MRHYGTVGIVDVIQVANASYHEYGTSYFVENASGRVVAEQGGTIKTVVIKDDGDAATPVAVIQNNGGTIESAYATTDTVATSNNAENVKNVQLEVAYYKAEANPGDVLTASGATEAQIQAAIEEEEDGVASAAANEQYKAEAGNADAVCRIGQAPYDSLPAAIEAASAGDTIQVLKDITSDSTVLVAKELIINGNGNKLTTEVTKESIMSISGSGAFTLRNLTVYANHIIAKGASNGTNADIFVGTTGVVTIEGCTFDGIDGAYYNVIEYGQDDNAVVADGTTFANNVFQGKAISHNCINVYKEAEGATIYITGNKFFNVYTQNTNPLRISDYDDTNVSFEIVDNEYNYVDTGDNKYAGFAFIQLNKGTCGKISLHFKNLKIMGNIATENNAETLNQVYYIYTADGHITFDGLKSVTFNQ